MRYTFAIIIIIAGLFLSSIDSIGQQPGHKLLKPNKIKLDSMTAAIKNQVVPNIHSVLISFNGKDVYNKYFKGEDEEWGDKKGVILHEQEDLHDLRSCSKSVVSACVGIAVSKGLIKSIDQKVMDFFPDYSDLDTGIRSTLTVKHLLTMSSGIVWNEDVPYNNPLNSEIRMTSSPDPLKYILSQPFSSKPGNIWGYNGGTTQLLASIIQKVSGHKIDDFAAKYLFEPLKFKGYDWKKFPGTDLPAAASGLRLRPQDMLKFGQLYLNNGIFNNQQILSRNWVEQSLKSHVARGKNSGYGYQFWIMDGQRLGVDYSLPACVGNGDQRIFIDQRKQLVVVVTAGNYNKQNIKKGSFDLLADYIYPALR